MRAKRRHRNADYVIATSVLLLIIIGLVALASASSDLGKLEYNNPYHYLQRQVIYGLGFGLIGFALGYFINYKKYKKISPVLLILGIGALVLTFTPLGASSGGAARWIAIGPVTFQPSEALKLFLIMYLAAWLSGTRSDRQKSLSEGLVPFLSILGTIAGLLILQRSTSAMVILMASALAVYYVGGAKREHVIASIGIGLLLVAGVILATPYRLERVKTFIHPTEETQGSAYQVNQALVTIGSGGAFGVGYGQSSIKTSLPERIGDSIFAVIAEEFGFVGSMFLISIFFALAIRGFLLSRRTRDSFGKLLLVGFSTIIGLQAFIHIGGNSGLIPLTGVPLPFISYGANSMAIFMTMSGIMLNISKRI